LRAAGGETWEDPTLADWPESECLWCASVKSCKLTQFRVPPPLRR
jgi:hypothetical protein